MSDNLLCFARVIEISIASIINKLFCKAKKRKKKLTHFDQSPMSLNNIQLDHSLLADLYKTSLVASDAGSVRTAKKPTSSSQTKATKTDPDSEKATNWKYLGEYKKNILIIVRYHDFQYLPDDQLNFLSAVLGACKLNLSDVAILNAVNDQSITYKNIQQKF